MLWKREFSLKVKVYALAKLTMLSRNIRRASILSRLRKEEKKAVFLAVLIGKAEQRPTKLEVKASFFHWLRVSNYYKSIEKFKIA